MVKAYIGAKPYSSFLRYALSSTLNFETDGNRRTLQCDEERGLTHALARCAKSARISRSASNERSVESRIAAAAASEGRSML